MPCTIIKEFIFAKNVNRSLDGRSTIFINTFPYPTNQTTNQAMLKQSIRNLQYDTICKVGPSIRPSVRPSSEAPPVATAEITCPHGGHDVIAVLQVPVWVRLESVHSCEP